MSLLRSVLLTAAIAVTGAPQPAAAQGHTTPGDTARAVTATLLKRLGEVVDGNRTGGTIYVVMSYRPPHDVAAIVGTADSALALARSLGPSWASFGPYRTAPDAPAGELFAIVTCPKDRITSLLVCPDSSASMVHALPIRNVALVRVTVQSTDGHLYTQTFSPDRVEAIFFTLSAIDKFAIPYYERVLGLSYADTLRARVQQWFLGAH